MTCRGRADGQWNATGTTLTTSDDEGIIRVYKRESTPGYGGDFNLMYSDVRQDLEAVGQDDGGGASLRRERQLALA